MATDGYDFLASRFEHDDFLNDLGDDCIDFIWSTFAEKVEEKWLASLQVPFTVNLAMEKIRKMVQLATIPHDGDISTSSEGLEKLPLDAEPTANAIDTWARGSVLTKKVIVEENPFRRTNEDAESRTPSVSSYRSSVTGKSRTASGSSRRGSRLLGVNSGSMYGDANELDKTGKIIELDEDMDDEYGDFGTTGQMFEQLQRAKRSKVPGHGVSSEDEVVKGEFDELEEQMQRASIELKGKKFVLDRYGKPVAMGKINPESLPSFSTTPVLSVKNDEGRAFLRRAGSSDEHGAPSPRVDAAGNRKKSVFRVAGHRGVDKESSFVPLTSMATTLSNVEHIQTLNPGVSVRSKDAVRAGSGLPESPDRVSKKTYFSRSANFAGSSSTLNGAFGESGVGSGGRDISQSIAGEGYGINNNNNSSIGQSQQFQQSTMRSIDAIPDIADPLEGGRRVEKKAAVSDPTDEELGLGPKTTAGVPQVGKLPGRVSAAHKANKANIELLTGSPDNGKPRDRDLPKNMRPVSERKHLPAPPLGHIAGHGLSLEKYVEKTALSHGESKEQEWYNQWRS